MSFTTCLTTLLIFGPALAVWSLQRKSAAWRRLRASGLVLAVWLVGLFPACQVLVTATIYAVQAGRSGGYPYAGLIQVAADAHNLDPALVAAVVEVESGFDASAVSPVGAMGLMQIMPGTAADLGLLEPFDAAANLDAGAEYLAWLIDRYGSAELALAAYNAGPGRVDACQCIPANGETPGYVRGVLAAAEGYRSPVIALPYRDAYRLISNGLHGEGDWPGRDFAAACGTPLYAPISGRVEAVGFDDYAGPHGSRNSFVLFANENTAVMMMHGEYFVTPGQTVSQGDLVGFEASIGNSSECHTHLAIRMRGELVDPVSIFEGR